MSRGNGVDLTGNSAGADFKPRLGRIRGDHPQLFINRVNKAVARSRAASGRTKWSGTSAHFFAARSEMSLEPGPHGVVAGDHMKISAKMVLGF